MRIGFNIGINLMAGLTPDEIETEIARIRTTLITAMRAASDLTLHSKVASFSRPTLANPTIHDENTRLRSRLTAIRRICEDGERSGADRLDRIYSITMED